MPCITRRDFAACSSGLALKASSLAGSPAPRNLLTGSFPPDRLARLLLPGESWRPFGAGDWSGVPDDARTGLIADGQRALNAPWPELPATLFLEFARNGNRSRYEKPWFERRGILRELVVAEAVENKGRFLDPIADRVWSVCEETYWGLPAHLHLQKAGPGLPDASEPTVDLFAAETGALLSWTLYLLAPELARVSPLIPERIQAEVERRILIPNLERDFPWMRVGMNWNPWIDSNWLAAVLIVERDEKRRLAAVGKIMRCLDAFLNAYHDDGGCDEGPGYWSRAGGSLFDCLELLHSATGGAISIYNAPLVKEIGRYTYRAHIQDDWFLNFADASAKSGVPGDLVLRYGRRIGDGKMAAFGAWAVMERGGGKTASDSIGRQLASAFNLAALRAAPRSQPFERDVWLPGIQVMAARSEKLYLAALGGHNAEAHNHNDVGSFVVFASGQPLLIDVGVETYSAKTFSARRYEIWTMQSAYHNLPTIGGVMQAAGRQFEARNVAYRCAAGTVEFSLDIARAYPPGAGLDSWKRAFRLDRARNEIEVADSYALNRPVSEITLSLMTPHRPAPEPGRLSVGPGGVAFDPHVFQPVVEEIALADARLKSTWGDRLYRILLRAANPPRSAAWKTRITPAPPA